jgi:acyl-coenzyme A thioesterase PaaI-like protein
MEARVEVLHAGKRVVHLDGRVRDGEGRLLAAASGSFAVLRRPEAPSAPPA